MHVLMLHRKFESNLDFLRIFKVALKFDLPNFMFLQVTLVMSSLY